MKTNVLERLDRGSLTAEIYEILKDKILVQEIAPGDRMIPAELASELGVSQTPVREALLALVQDGLVLQTPRKGFYVNQITASKVRQMYDVRLALEIHTAPFIVERISSDEIKYLWNILEKVYPSEKWDAEEDSRFHIYLISTYGNHELTEVFQDVETRKLLIGRMAPRILAEPLKVAEEHASIMHALEMRDVEGLIEALKLHNRRSADSFVSS